MSRLKSIIKAIFLYKFSRQQISYLLSATVALSVLAIVFDYLESHGGRHVYLTFIPLEVKDAIAQTVEVVALLLVIYFVIRFILGFFIDKEEKKSPEIKAIEHLQESIDNLSKTTTDTKAVKYANKKTTGIVKKQ